ncbi:hypothetical protein Neosp_015074 [[Neocosmospora] mangrovei]
MSQDDNQDVLVSDLSPVDRQVSETAENEYDDFQDILENKPNEDHEARFTFCLCIRGRMLRDVAKYEGCFKRCYDLMERESARFREIMANLTLENPLERKKWYAFYLHAIGQPYGYPGRRSTPGRIMTTLDLTSFTSDIHDPPLKRRHLDDDDCPAPDPVSDQEWVNKVLRETIDWIRNEPPKHETHRTVTGREIVGYLESGRFPTLNSEAFYCSPTEARRMVELGNITVPIITNKQQPFNCGDDQRPITAFLAQWTQDVDRSAKVSVNIPTLPSNKSMREDKTMEQIYRKFVRKGGPKNHLWLLLDLINPVPTPYPAFLTFPECQFLHHCQNADKEVSGQPEQFLLLSEGGNHTSAHVDSHGMGTFITAQEGFYGFGWIHISDDKVHDEWAKDPSNVKHLARYIVLRPGQTVYFPPNTIHFVFRALDEPTLGTGAHIVRWSSSFEWLRIMRSQELDQSISNSDVTARSVKKWTKPLLRIAEKCISCKDEAKLGGPEEAERIVATIKASSQTGYVYSGTD